MSICYLITFIMNTIFFSNKSFVYTDITFLSKCIFVQYPKI